MMNKRVVITGVGVLACNGKGKEEFWNALRNGQHGFKPITLFEIDERFRVNIAGEVSDFDPTIYMGQKGLRSLDRATKLICSSARLCIDDSGFKITEENTDNVGVSVGTTFGSLKSISDFDKVTLTEGPRYTNPAHFPNTVINSPASQISIWNNIQGFNTTISTGFTSSIDAFSYASDFIKSGRIKMVYTGSVEELCEPTFLGFHTLKYLSGSIENDKYISCPFDRRRNGITFGEGACLLAFEDLDHAVERKARIDAEVLGFGYYFDPYRLNKFNPKGIGMIEAMKDALNDAQLGIDDIDYICANANSTPAADRIETKAIKEVFGKRSRKIPISSIKSMVGESYSAGGAFAAAASVGTLVEGFIPPTINYKEADPECDLDYVPNQSRKAKVKNILINSFGPSGNHACMVLGKYDS
ncbi:MAG: beta-ketoacyl-[acyl-carrier-protein] synthase family protein [Candidatus Omnitrophica bacterium]|nr:beta-ketoacyl-[acyl-carrier-protein] synthase family protein [Candidatus Omnitrophota bacterium]